MSKKNVCRRAKLQNGCTTKVLVYTHIALQRLATLRSDERDIDDSANEVPQVGFGSVSWSTRTKISAIYQKTYMKRSWRGIGQKKSIDK